VDSVPALVCYFDRFPWYIRFRDEASSGKDLADRHVFLVGSGSLPGFPSGLSAHVPFFPLGTLLYFESKVISWAKPHEITHNFSDESEDEQCQSVGY